MVKFTVIKSPLTQRLIKQEIPGRRNGAEYFFVTVLIIIIHYLHGHVYYVIIQHVLVNSNI